MNQFELGALYRRYPTHFHLLRVDRRPGAAAHGGPVPVPVPDRCPVGPPVPPPWSPCGPTCPAISNGRRKYYQIDIPRTDEILRDEIMIRLMSRDVAAHMCITISARHETKYSSHSRNHKRSGHHHDDRRDTETGTTGSGATARAPAPTGGSDGRFRTL